MQQQFEHQYHRVEADHWWFVGRRQAIRNLLLAGGPSRNCRILEVGCSAGPLMTRLQRDGYRNIVGIDCSQEAIDLCHQSQLDAQVMDARKLSFADASVDIIIASDILEHLEDDGAALREWHRVLKPDGLLIVFVPAFMFLWTGHDVVNKHFRRYNRSDLAGKLKNARFAVERSSYWNTFLFPPVALVRRIKRWIRRGSFPVDGKGDLFVPTPVLNSTLLGILSLENLFFKWGINWPFGVSTMALARKPVT
jgi:SAM-dependent methyltransferase